MTAHTTAAPLTLVVRLSGPLQSWGEHAPYTHRGTLPYPTYSGLLGLARAALGLPRDADPVEWSWLRTLDMALRIDRPGQVMGDYHTVNPPPAGHWNPGFLRPRKGSKSSAKPYTVPSGSGKAWGLGTMLTTREYMTDAAYTWLTAGPSDLVRGLGRALLRPQWQLSLGRKACLPDWPLVLGITTTSAKELLVTVPVVTPDARTSVTEVVADVHQLAGPSDPDAAHPAEEVTHVDDPAGSHPHHGHNPRTRVITTITAPVVHHRLAMLDWAQQNLEAP